jgi:hypothetical protein
MPTRMYSNVEFSVEVSFAVALASVMNVEIMYSSLLSFLQALTGFGEVDERYKRHNGHHDGNQIKHVIPPRQAADFENP